MWFCFFFDEECELCVLRSGIEWDAGEEYWFQAHAYWHLNFELLVRAAALVPQESADEGGKEGKSELINFRFNERILWIVIKLHLEINCIIM